MKPKEILTAAQLDDVRRKAQRAILPLAPAANGREYAVGSKRTKAGEKLPEYYLVHFLLVDLLQFPKFGRCEKVAWSVPVDFEGNFAWIEHRKFGLGIFSTGKQQGELVAAQIAKAINRGVSAAKPFFDHLASIAVRKSQLNIVNNSTWLFERYQYLRELFDKKIQEATMHKDEVTATRNESSRGFVTTLFSYPRVRLSKESTWLALSVIEAFFSWTEHVFIHIAVLRGTVQTGSDVANLAQGDWTTKVKAALRVDQPNIKKLVDELIVMRRQIRNYLAHGAFGKEGEAFMFHSPVGAVPVVLNDHIGLGRFSLWEKPLFDEGKALKLIDLFLEEIWTSGLEPAELYIQQAVLPAILPYAANGVYARAMASMPEMKELASYLSMQMDDAANMDW